MPPDLTADERLDAAIEGYEERIEAYTPIAEAEKKEAIEKAAHADKMESGDTHATKEASEFGLGENLREAGNAIVGGLRDSVNSILTAPERVVDMISGEMEEKMKDGGYVPDWNPFGNNENFQTKTNWGNLLRSGIHFSSMFVPIAGIAGKVGQGTSLLARATKATMLSKNLFVRGASVGAVQDLVSKYSQDEVNLSAQLRDKNGWIDTPWATKDGDHPMMLTLKNMVEGMGMGIIFDGSLKGLAFGRDRLFTRNKPDRINMDAGARVDTIEHQAKRRAEDTAKFQVDKLLRAETKQKLFNKGINFDKLDADQQIEQMALVKKRNRSGKYRTWTPPNESNLERADRKIADRNKSVQDQTIEKGVQELDDPGKRGHKNKIISEPHQGNPNSTGRAWDVDKQSNRIDNELSAEYGSTESLITPAAAEMVAENGLGARGITPAVAKDLMGDARFKALMEDLNAKGQTLEDAYGNAFRRMQEVLGGRDAGALEPEEFWAPITNSAQDVKGGIEHWQLDNVISAELVTGSLFKQLRDRATVARELAGEVDINAPDGPIKYIRDNLIVGMEQVKRSRLLASEAGIALSKEPGGNKALVEALNDIHVETKGQVDMMLDLARNDPSDEFLHALLEAFSMSHKINNWDDFDVFMRNKLLGSTSAAGKRETGQLIKELQGVMIHSILSGPKTPIRAIMGTGTAVFTRPMSLALGGAMRYAGSGFTDDTILRQGLASLNAMVQTVPDAMEYFFTRLNSYWSGDISTIKTRYAEMNQSDETWELMGFWADSYGSAGDRAAYRVTNLARSANQNSFLTYSTKLMAATDDAFTMILARARAKEKAFLGALDAKASGIIPDISPNVIKEYEGRLYNEIFDPETGGISDNMLKYARGEATLSKDISGFGKALDDMFSSQPALKPFYLFARTGINGLELSFKHTPGLNFLVKEFNDIAWATPDNLQDVLKYGIETPQDLINAKALQNGRLALGSAVIFSASQFYLNGQLTGNGPADPRKRRVWESAGWQPRSVKIGDVWVGYESFEPFSNILASIADLGDNQELMGEKWVEQGLLGNAVIIAKGITSKTYLQGLQQLFSIFSNDPKKGEKIIAGLMNNAMPMAGLRNEIGRVITPYQRELNSGFEDQVRNRNLALEQLTDDKLPIKYDILTGRPIKDWNPLVRLYNAISPVSLNHDQSPGRAFLMRSNFDLSVTFMTAPDGTKLHDSPEARSLFQKAIGDQNIEKKLAKLAERPDIQESLKLMEYHIRTGLRGKYKPMDYTHNKLIAKIFRQAKVKAWAMIQSDPNIMSLVAARKLQKGAKYNLNTRPARSEKQMEEADRLLQLINK